MQEGDGERRGEEGIKKLVRRWREKLGRKREQHMLGLTPEWL